MTHTIFWFRRDLRLNDNTALFEALNKSNNVLPIFIFDEHILEELPKDDPRVHFIYCTLQNINKQLKQYNSSLLIKKGKPVEVWKQLIHEFEIERVYINKDYEPYAITRDNQVAELLKENNINLFAYKDQVIFEESEVMKADGTPYTVFTPYKNRWLTLFDGLEIKSKISFKNFYQSSYKFPVAKELGILASNIQVKDFSLEQIGKYEENRNFPAIDATSYLGPHLRFGTVSIRQIVSSVYKISDVFLSELIWREFFVQILFHFPKVLNHNFRSKYDGINWINNEEDFEKWSQGNTGYPMVDAGMRQLNQTGYMHNRVRMVVAGFLCKHLLIDWRLGEAYFAQKLLDYELASNNGNWQWAAGTGCDAAPYFRVFNPTEQLKKFDANHVYVKRWIKELGTKEYPLPMIDHAFARNRAIEKYKKEIIQ